jgi:hypothetical protein
MKKITASLTGALSLLILLLMLFYACRRDYDPVEQNSNRNLDVTSARSYYKKLVKAEGNQVPAKFSSHNTAPQKDANGKPVFNNKYLVWKQAYTSETDKMSFVEVPLYYNQKISSIIRPGEGNSLAMTAMEQKIYASSLNRLLIYKDKINNTISKYIVSYIPDSTYLQNHKYDISNNQINKIDKDFSGYIKYLSWDGEPKAVFKLKNGKPVSRGNYITEITYTGNTRIAKPLDNRAAGNAAARQECYTEEDFLYISVCYYPNPEDPSDHFCVWVEVVSSHEVCWNVPDDGGPTYNDPCFNPANFATTPCNVSPPVTPSDPPTDPTNPGSGSGGSGSCIEGFTDNLNGQEFICPKSFQWTVTINAPANAPGGWQVAAVDGIHISIPYNGIQLLNLPTIYVGVPKKDLSTDFIAPSTARTWAAAAVEYAETKVMEQYQATGTVNANTMIPYYIQQINEYMATHHDGSAGTTGSPAIVPTTASYSYSCNCY